MTALSNFFGGPSGSWDSGTSNWRCETFTSSGTFDPTGKGNGEFSVILVGGGASGGICGWVSGLYGNIAGGCGGGVTIFDSYISSSASVVIGSGGAAITSSSIAVLGNRGSRSTFTVDGLVYTAQGGESFLMGQSGNAWIESSGMNPLINSSKYIVFKQEGNPLLGNSYDAYFPNFNTVPGPVRTISASKYIALGGSSYNSGPKTIIDLYTSDYNGTSGTMGAGGSPGWISGTGTVTSGAGGDGICFIWWRE